MTSRVLCAPAKRRPRPIDRPVSELTADMSQHSVVASAILPLLSSSVAPEPVLAHGGRRPRPKQPDNNFTLTPDRARTAASSHLNAIRLRLPHICAIVAAILALGVPAAAQPVDVPTVLTLTEASTGCPNPRSALTRPSE